MHENRGLQKFKMAALRDDVDLRGSMETSDDTERSDNFWDPVIIAMKSTVEREWIKSVRKSKKKPNFGMGNLDALHEEVCGSKLEISGPLIDSYLGEFGNGIQQKLIRSKATGLVSPIVLFIPWSVFKYFLPFTSGYDAEVNETTHKKKCKTLSIEIAKNITAQKVFSPQRFSNKNVLTKRFFTKDKHKTYKYGSKSTVVVSKQTPMTITYSMKKQRATLTIYVQRYDEHDFANNVQRQALMNN